MDETIMYIKLEEIVASNDRARRRGFIAGVLFVLLVRKALITYGNNYDRTSEKSRN